MAREMKFRDQVGELEVVDVEVRVVFEKTFEMMNGPFTSNVVRNNNITNGHVFQHGCDNIIRVDVSRRCLESLCCRMGGHVPFTPLQVTNTILHHEGVPRTDTSDNA